MLFAKKLLVVFVCGAVAAYAEGNTFTKVRYNGGSVASTVNPKDWGNTLKVTPEAITLVLKDQNKVEIPPKTVTSLSYGQEAHRRVGTMIALAVLVAPVALFGLLHKTRLHYIGVQYKMPDGKNGGILLQGDKDNYRSMLVALQGVTGAPVSVGEKEREFVPVGVTTAVAKDADEKKPATKDEPASGVGTIVVETAPPGADVYIDDQFYGNGPATLKLRAGKHTIKVKMAGYKDWSRDVTCDVGSEAHLTATLDETN